MGHLAFGYFLCHKPLDISCVIRKEMKLKSPFILIRMRGSGEDHRI